MTEISPSELKAKYEGRVRIDPHIHLEGPLKGAPEVIEYLDKHGVDVGFLIASPLKEGKCSMNWDMPALQKKYLGGLGNTAFGHFVSGKVMRPFVEGMTVEKPDNNRVVAVSKEHPDRLMSWIFANPGLGVRKTLNELSTFVGRQDRIAGLKLHFWIYPANIVDLDVMQIADIAQEKKLPILIDVGVNRGNMKNFDEFAKRHPEVPIIAAHLGSNLPEVMDAASRNPNVFLDMSGYPVTGYNLRKIFERLAPDKVIFIGTDGTASFGKRIKEGAASKIIWGSDSPGGLGGSIVSQLRALHDAQLHPSQEDLILTGNITSIIPQVSKLLKARS